MLNFAEKLKPFTAASTAQAATETAERAKLVAGPVLGSQSLPYALAGVDITAGYESVELIKQHVQKTRTPQVRSDIGGFASLYELDLTAYPRPLLVSGTDGVGTKLKYAFALDKHDSIGIDCVAMCVNDIICVGAQPLYFLDYIACGKNVPAKIAAIVKGISAGCLEAGCALVGGETAEMPGFYPQDEYDLAGYVTGVVNKQDLIQSGQVREGDVLIALASSGVHSNGYSLLRKLFPPATCNLNEALPALKGQTLGAALLQPTKIYVKSVLALLQAYPQSVHGIAHITGGGFYENIPRILTGAQAAYIFKEKLQILDIFKYIQKQGAIAERDMFNTFNMGVGMCLAVDKNYSQALLQKLQAEGETAYELGYVGLREQEAVVFI